MIRGHAISMLHVFDVPQKFKVMSLMIETIKRTAADQKRSCGYAPQIQELINSKMGTGKYQLDKEHFPLYPDGIIVWMSEGTRYQSTVEEWASLINAPKK